MPSDQWSQLLYYLSQCLMSCSHSQSHTRFQLDELSRVDRNYVFPKANFWQLFWQCIVICNINCSTISVCLKAKQPITLCWSLHGDLKWSTFVDASWRLSLSRQICQQVFAIGSSDHWHVGSLLQIFTQWHGHRHLSPNYLLRDYQSTTWLKASWLRLNPTKTQVIRWCGWVLHNSWQKSTFRRFRWRQHVWTSRRWPVTSATSSTASWRCLHRWPPCVAVATTSYGSSDRSSDRCHPTPSRCWSRRLFCVTLTTATRCSTTSLTVWWAGCSLLRMRLRDWCWVLDAMTT